MWSRWRRKVLGGAVALLLCPLAGAEPVRPLVMLVETSALMPQARIVADQVVEGLHLDLGQALARRLGRELVARPVPRKRLAEALQRGEGDLLCDYQSDWLPGAFAWSRPFLPDQALLISAATAPAPAGLTALAGQPVVVTGSLIQRGQQAMIAVDEVGDWVRRDERTPVADPALLMPGAEPLGEVSLAGEILDSKCWFGAMRPSSGKVHKACAALCIRGGIPPAFFARGPGGQDSLMIMTSGGHAHGPELLGLVADPVQVQGRVHRLGDLRVLDAPVAAIRRL